MTPRTPRILPTLLLALATASARAEDPVAEIDAAVARAAQRAAPAVVAIEVQRDESKGAHEGPALPPVMPGARTRSILDYYSRPKGPVSGVILEPDGFVITTWYNVVGEAASITVFVDGAPRPAKLLGWSELHDVALLKIDGQDLPTLPPAPTESFVQGRLCIHVGRSPTPARTTVTWGIVSAAHRWEDTALQTDAEMNFASAGGAVVDREGRLLGIAAHLADRTTWGQDSGVGFVARIAKIREILPRLKAGEKIERQIGYLGVAFSEADGGGVALSHVAPDRPNAPSPAAKAGLQQGDVLLEFNEKPIDSIDLLVEEIRGTKPGTKVKIKYKRGEETKEVEVVIVNKPIPD